MVVLGEDSAWETGDVQLRDAVLTWLLGSEKLLSSEVQATLLPSSMLGVNCRVTGVVLGLRISRGLRWEKEK